MDLIKAISDNVVLVSAILFILLLVLYGLFYKKDGSHQQSKSKEGGSKEPQDPQKKNNEKFISYLFYFIFGSLGIYALYLIYIKYVTRNLIESTMPSPGPSRSGITGMSGGGISGGSSGPSMSTAANAQKLATAPGNYSIKMTGGDIDVGFMD